MYKIEIVKEGEHTRMLLNGKHKRFSLTVDWVAQQSVWLIVMHIEIDDIKFTCPEYYYELCIDHELLSTMAGHLEDSVNGYFE